jgi:hypothetical protein
MISLFFIAVLTLIVMYLWAQLLNASAENKRLKDQVRRYKGIALQERLKWRGSLR